MNQEPVQLPIQSLHSTNETQKQKRPYNKISQEMRSQILHALTVENLPLQMVADKFQTKACTCKAILLTYENEGRSQKKTNRRERVEISSAIRFVIQDPIGRNNQVFNYIKSSKIYTEKKQLTRQEEATLQKKLKSELQYQLGELQQGCYSIEQNVHSKNLLDERSPANIVRGINMSIHLISQKIKKGEILVSNKFSDGQQKSQTNGQKEEHKREDVKNNGIPEKFQKEEEYKHNPEIIENFYKIKMYVENVSQRIQQQPQLLVQLNYLTNETILQSRFRQGMEQKEFSVQNLKSAIQQHLKQSFHSF